MAVETPEWVKHAVFYQIFPDRFARSPRTRHPRGQQFKPWGSPPEEQGFQGGDLHGIVDHLDYLKQLGINAIYLNPIFASASNHRYHTFDYFQVDPLLGGNAALRELLDQAHAMGIKVVLDGVFNHASRGFWQFHHILENGGNSPYIDWFIIHGWPLRPYRETADQELNYEAWIGLPALPKLNTNNPGVRDFIMSVARYWLEFGIDGWRLDVPFEIDDDSFWQEFRRVVKGANPDAYIVGEVWRPAQRWLQGDQFDAVMNYIFARLAMGFCGAETINSDIVLDGDRHVPLNAEQVRRGIDEMLGLYDWQIDLAQLNMLDSHDTPRALWHMGGDMSALKLCTLLQMTMPGAPNIYYGSEIGMTGGPDPGCRGAFPWDAESRWDTELLDYFHRVIRMRHEHPVLRTGTFTSLYGQNGVYAFLREQNGQQAIAAFNANKEPATVNLPLPQNLAGGRHFRAIWGEGRDYTAGVDMLVGVSIPARQGVVLLGAL
ncbi:MAG TPA: glycoside hydrolase family 13 protein [Chloroflexia bacterium]|jgi:neopullulanase